MEEEYPPKTNLIWWHGYFDGYEAVSPAQNGDEYNKGWAAGQKDLKKDEEWLNRHGSSNT